MNTIRASAWSAILILVSALPALAQGGTSPDRSVTLSVGGTGVLTWMTSGVDVRATLSVPVTERVSLEFFGAPYRGNSSDDWDLNVKGFYGVQVKREIDRGRRAGVTPFLTFGGAGLIARGSKYDCSFGTCHRREATEVLPPVLGLFGGGVEVVVGSRLALRFEAQGIVAIVIPAGVRASASFTIPIGHRFASRLRSGSR